MNFEACRKCSGPATEAMWHHCCPDETVIEKVCPPVCREWFYSLAIAVGMLVRGGFSQDGFAHGIGWFVPAWIGMSIVTGIARYTGGLTRRECRDLRFMWFSLHGKIPVWVNWVFWLVMAAVLIRPIFALTVYAAVGIAFFRGYRFVCSCRACRTALAADILIRASGGLFV